MRLRWPARRHPRHLLTARRGLRSDPPAGVVGGVEGKPERVPDRELPCGTSTGADLVAALRVGQTLPPEAQVVTLAVGAGFRCLRKAPYV